MNTCDKSSVDASDRGKRCGARVSADFSSRCYGAWTSIARRAAKRSTLASATQAAVAAALGTRFPTREVAAFASTILASRLKIGRIERHGVDEADSNR